MLQAPNALLFFFPVITWLAFLLILALFTEDAALHSKFAVLPEPTHSCPSFLPTLVPVQLHNCPLHFFPRLLFSWITSWFWLISKYEPVANSILHSITRQVRKGGGEHVIVLFSLFSLWKWLTTSWFWTTQTFCNASLVNLLPTCHLWCSHTIYSACRFYLLAFFP